MDASTELIRAMFDTLRATTAVAALVDGRIYDPPPQKQDGSPAVPFPYISLGPSTTIPDDADCIPAEEITVQLDIWSSGSGAAHSSVECRKICDAVKRALHGADLVLSGNALVTLQHELTRIMDDPNPAINHGAVQFTATVELH